MLNYSYSAIVMTSLQVKVKSFNNSDSYKIYNFGLVFQVQ